MGHYGAWVPFIVATLVASTFLFGHGGDASYSCHGPAIAEVVHPAQEGTPGRPEAHPDSSSAERTPVGVERRVRLREPHDRVDDQELAGEVPEAGKTGHGLRVS